MTRCLLILLVSVMALACRAGERAPAAADASRAERPARDDDADTIHIDPGMLRDLRMTTARVEERTGAADVDMLGEISVNRDAYAKWHHRSTPR